MIGPRSPQDLALDLWAYGAHATAIAAVLGKSRGRVTGWVLDARRAGDPRAEQGVHHPDRVALADADEPPVSPVKRIIWEEARARRVPVSLVVGMSRLDGAVAARRAAARRLTDERRMSTVQIGRALGNRHHTTILNLLGRTRTAADREAKHAGAPA